MKQRRICMWMRCFLKTGERNAKLTKGNRRLVVFRDYLAVEYLQGGSEGLNNHEIKQWKRRK